MSDLTEQLRSSLGDAYAIERELAGGGMARVFVAHETALSRRVVVKVLRPELAEGLSADRFAREVRLAASLQDPRIVPVLSAGAIGGLPYYTMPYMEGESLRARLTRLHESGGTLSIDRALTLLRDVAMALETAHERGIVHRDIKPENVLLSAGARSAAVTDFGIAKAVESARTAGATLTAAGTALGTPAYMAPEQAAGDAVDAQADIYAWGVMAYEILAGVHPFAGKSTAQQLIAAHVSEVPTPLSRRDPSVRPALGTLVDRCLAKDPRARPRGARELIDGLNALAATNERGSVLGLPTLVKPEPRVRWLVVAATVAVVAIVMAAGVWIDRARRSRVPLDPQLITVVPFRVVASDPALRYLREGMLDLVAAKLLRSPRTADQRAVLAAWRSAGGSDTRDVDRGSAVRIARRLGAGRLLEGSIIQQGAQITLNATLVEAAAGVERASATAVGAPAQIAQLVDSVVSKVLALEAGETEERATLLSRIPQPALVAYLQGQAAYRRGRYSDAVNAYAEAIQVDSTFALAGLALSSAGGWTTDPRGARGRQVAVAHAERLPLRDRLILGPTSADSTATTSQASLARVERALAVAPDSPELWAILADRYFHYGGAVVGEDEAYRRAARAFERALELDSTFAPAVEHLPWIYERLGDSSRARAATALLLRDSTALYAPSTRYFAATTAQDRAAARAEIAAAPPVVATVMVMEALTRGRVAEIDDVLREVRARVVTADDRRVVADAEYFAAMYGGQPSRGRRIAQELPSRLAERMFAATFWDGDPVDAAQQRDEVIATLGAPIPADPAGRRARMVAMFDLAEYELARGETTHAAAVIDRLRKVPASPNDPIVTALGPRLALVLDAQLAALAGRADARARLESLDSLLALAPRGGHLLTAGNLVASRLWERAGNLERAYLATTRWSPGAASDEFVLESTYLRERGRLAAALGRREDAIRAYRQYLAMRPDPEPRLRREVEGIRRDLARLERASAGR